MSIGTRDGEGKRYMKGPQLGRCRGPISAQPRSKPCGLVFNKLEGLAACAVSLVDFGAAYSGVWRQGDAEVERGIDGDQR